MNKVGLQGDFTLIIQTRIRTAIGEHFLWTAKWPLLSDLFDIVERPNKRGQTTCRKIGEAESSGLSRKLLGLNLALKSSIWPEIMIG